MVLKQRRINKDLEHGHVNEIIKKSTTRHKKTLQEHVNVEVVQLLDTEKDLRRLKRKKQFDLVIG